MQGLQSRMLHLVLAAHLLDEQLGVRAYLDILFAVRDSPAKRRQQSVVLGDVIGGDSQAAVQLVDEPAFGIFDADAVAGRAGITPRAAIDVNGDHVRR